ncbi:MAG: hypothetical protein IH969_01850 [Candidatus Krumholzibacteriota bacterium]|nr:hypothetical protein [Candidatus Krumholzibacteriota bacterium]
MKLTSEAITATMSNRMYFEKMGTLPEEETSNHRPIEHRDKQYVYNGHAHHPEPDVQEANRIKGQREYEEEEHGLQQLGSSSR